MFLGYISKHILFSHLRTARKPGGRNGHGTGTVDRQQRDAPGQPRNTLLLIASVPGRSPEPAGGGRVPRRPAPAPRVWAGGDRLRAPRRPACDALVEEPEERHYCPAGGGYYCARHAQSAAHDCRAALRAT